MLTFRTLRILRSTALPLVLLGAAVLVGALGRTFRPDIPQGWVFALAAALASSALLFPSFRRVAFVDFLYENNVFFGAGVVTALLWANLDHDSYGATTEPIKDRIVNDVLMALFFGVAAKEVFEALLPGGPLASRKQAALPLVATAGGMLGPALLYAGGAYALHAPELARGWAIPTATDIAFSAIVARSAFGPRHPAIPFLLLLAIADDAGGLAILAVFYPKHPIAAGWLGLIALAVVAGLLLKRAGVRTPWAWLLGPGVASWIGFHEAGLHPALALVPIIPTMPHAHRDAGLFVEDTSPHVESTLEILERHLAAPVALILGLFGLVNAGVTFASVGTPTLLVVGALALGKPLGISLSCALGTRLGLALPEGLGAKEVVVLGVTAGIGFTVALFVATVAFDAPETRSTLDQAKMGALLSVAAAPVGIALARIVGVRRRV